MRTDDEIVAILNSHRRGGGARGCVRIDRAAVEFDVGEDGIGAVDEWVEARGSLVSTRQRKARGLRARARVERYRPELLTLQYELPRELLEPPRE